MSAIPARRFLRRHLPFASQLGALLHLLRTVPLRLRGTEQRFNAIYRRNAWRGTESLSGPGSSLEATAALRQELPGLLARLDCRTLLDAPCGDFRWMSAMALPIESYLGVDIVAAVIEANRRLYGDPRRTFLRLDLLRDPLPAADLVLCRDCLVHFSYRDAASALRAFRRAGAAFLLTTTFPERRANRDIVTGEWRPLNLQIAPFNFPPPLALVTEDYTGDEGQYRDKSLALWRLGEFGLESWAR
ncbi:MAG TPA: class I SAM-dependent methyltransferase [Thermoanaerobaculia bacterium]|nr:class I SAM-dependent methyltransferase [Thermoanaerobaculia bacterium]